MLEGIIGEMFVANRDKLRIFVFFHVHIMKNLYLEKGFGRGVQLLEVRTEVYKLGGRRERT